MNNFDVNPDSSFDNQLSFSLEQEFDVVAFNTQVDGMSEQQAKALLKIIYQQMKAKEKAYQQLLKHQWGLDKPFDDI